MISIFGKEIQIVYTILGIEVNIIAQIFGLFMLITLCTAYLAKNKIQYYLLSVIANVFCMLEMFALGAYAAMLCNLIVVIRNCVIIHAIKNGKTMSNKASAIYIIPVIAIAAFGVIYEKTWLSIIPPILTIADTVLSIQPNFKLLKTCIIFLAMGYMIYDMFIGAYIGVLRQAIMTVASIVGLIRYLKHIKRHPEAASDSENKAEAADNA